MAKLIFLLLKSGFSMTNRVCVWPALSNQRAFVINIKEIIAGLSVQQIKCQCNRTIPLRMDLTATFIFSVGAVPHKIITENLWFTEKVQGAISRPGWFGLVFANTDFTLSSFVFCCKSVENVFYSLHTVKTAYHCSFNTFNSFICYPALGTCSLYTKEGCMDYFRVGIQRGL